MFGLKCGNLHLSLVRDRQLFQTSETVQLQDCVVSLVVCFKEKLWSPCQAGPPAAIIGESGSESHSLVSDSLQPHGLYSPRNSPGQNTGTGGLSLLQGIFPTQGSNQGVLHCRQILYQLAFRETQGRQKPMNEESPWGSKRVHRSLVTRG